jgi:ribosomal protein S18
LEEQLKKLKIKEKKQRKSIYRTEHEKACVAVKPLLPGIKELNYNALWWLSQYVTHYKKLLAETDPKVKRVFNNYQSWIYKTKAKADFGEVSADVETGVDGEAGVDGESEEESEEEVDEEEEEEEDVGYKKLDLSKK